MNDNSTTVTKQETLAALRTPGELYVIMSGATRLPFVFCDEETFDDEIFLYYRADDAKEKAKELLFRLFFYLPACRAFDRDVGIRVCHNILS